MQNTRPSLKGKLSLRTLSSNEAYIGPYIVSPTDTVQVLNTSGRVMLKDVTINSIPPNYIDTDDANLDSSSKMLSGVTAYSNGIKYTGTIPSLEATQYSGGRNTEIIQPGQYIASPLTILGDDNLLPENIAYGVSIYGVSGSLMPTVITETVNPDGGTILEITTGAHS